MQLSRLIQTRLSKDQITFLWFHLKFFIYRRNHNWLGFTIFAINFNPFEFIKLVSFEYTNTQSISFFFFLPHRTSLKRNLKDINNHPCISRTHHWFISRYPANNKSDQYLPQWMSPAPKLIWIVSYWVFILSHVQ